ncbi:hypothetical protein HZU77_001030 [Neisseriaceae bacterium TC5R-5]|nr:hypothetical protein [Neisseriaceae bacterium TC5R-5]
MKQCPQIEAIKFDQNSLAAIEEIRQKVKVANLGAAMTGVGVMTTIFYRNGPLSASYNIYATDWKLVQESMNSWSAILKRVVQDIAYRQEMDHFADRKQKLFWKAVADGCQIQ